ncbi:MAG: 3-isopropylmalate dehydratase large subunit [Ignavibacteriae bacterium]|nr:3-isopropylmalate dehydratase large subunit [Ignavibacteriota bacterium]
MSTATAPRTLFEKIWDTHVVASEPGAPTLIYIDLQLVHEVTSPQAFTGLRRRGLTVRRPERTVATVDHSIPTLANAVPDALAAAQIATLEKNATESGIRLFGSKSHDGGVVHVLGPEQGFTRPGMTIVCGDSHTSTHGAFGALAFGIGTSEVEHVLATQCLLQQRPRTAEVRIEGKLQKGVTAKDVILALLAKIGVGGGTGYVFEYTGSTVRNFTMEERMTLCNMSIEGGARAGMVAPDEVTFAYLAERGIDKAELEASVPLWRALLTDPGAQYDHTISLDVSELAPMVTFGTNPGMGVQVTGRIPDPEQVADASGKSTLKNALHYMGLTAGQAVLGQPIQVVFIGSCTNGRISDLRAAASVLKGRSVAKGVRMLVVPGSRAVKRQAEAEGLDRIFREAGAEWREPGCSMCIAMNGDEVAAGQYAVSTSNRNFEGRQGRGSRTFLASPLTAAASAVTGTLTDVRSMA